MQHRKDLEAAATLLNAALMRIVEEAVTHLGGPTVKGGRVNAVFANAQPEPHTLLDWTLLGARGERLARVRATYRVPALSGRHLISKHADGSITCPIDVSIEYYELPTEPTPNPDTNPGQGAPS